MDGLNSRMEKTGGEKKISGVEHRTIKVTQSEQGTEHTLKKMSVLSLQLFVNLSLFQHKKLFLK